MTNKNNKNKILGGGEPNLRSKFGAKEFYFGYFGCLLIFGILLPSIAAAQFVLPTNQLPNLNLKPTLSLTSDPITPQPNLIITVIANL